MQSTDICAVTCPIVSKLINMPWKVLHSSTFPAPSPHLLSLPSLLSGKHLLILQDSAKMSPSLWNSPKSLRQHESLLLHALQAECIFSSIIHHLYHLHLFTSPSLPLEVNSSRAKTALLTLSFPVSHFDLATISCGCPMRILWPRMWKWLAQGYPANLEQSWD